MTARSFMLLKMSSSRQICSRNGCKKTTFVESNGFVHPYCGRTCAFEVLNNPPATPRCKNPVCSRQRYTDPSGIQYDYCGKNCARQHLNPKAINCSRPNCQKRVYTDPQDKKKTYSYCSSVCYWLECSTLTQTKSTLLNKNDLDYIWAHQRFISMLPNVKIKGIIRLQMPKKLVDAHQKLKKKLATQGSLSFNAVTHKMYHGTKTLCDPLQYMKQLSPNCGAGCGLCGIVSRGNDTACSRNNNNMWFANNPSVSYGYCNNPIKVIFMVDVLSIISQPILIVDKNALTLPRFLIIFQ